jgi:hypothetical protein
MSKVTPKEAVQLAVQMHQMNVTPHDVDVLTILVEEFAWAAYEKGQKDSKKAKKGSTKG